MNRERAIQILEIPRGSELTDDVLKKHYRIKALQYHPDKNSEPGAANKFMEIKDAYDYLLGNVSGVGCGLDSNDNSYSTILQMFLNGLWKGEANNRLFSVIIENIVTCCEAKILDILEKLDNDTLIKIHDVFSKYNNVFHYSEGFLKYVELVLSNKIKNDNCIILNPSIDDLFDCNLYKVTENGYTYIVPLWHHELVYDNSGCDLYVRCNPILSENISIDEENNIHYFAKYSIGDIFDKETIDIAIGLRKFSLFVSRLYIKPVQTVLLSGRGIPRICGDDVYNVSRRGDIHIHIELDRA
uniref:J domain-containing protein n=1 Tax=viral metagenome TaxID=1070528 RepID=A0A6C0K004_9ZZZZ